MTVSEGEWVQTEDALYADWKRYGPHLAEYASEFAGTLFNVFCVVGVVAWMFAPSSPVARALPAVGLRLLITGLVLGGSGGLVALSPLGRLSGAHINPAVSLGFWLLGKMHRRDLAGYVAAQMAGGACGALLAVPTFGTVARQTHGATLRPGPSVGPGLAFAAEAGTTLALTFLIYSFVSHKALMRWTPGAATVMVGLLVWLDGEVSGAGMDPARWFGPAVVADYWRLGWVYALGPLLGALIAAGLRRTGLFGPPTPHTGKQFHDPRYRSLFREDAVPSTPPRSRRQPPP